MKGAIQGAWGSCLSVIAAGAFAGAGASLADEQGMMWALQPIGDPDPPRLQEGWGRNAVDAFILAGLKDRGLRPAPPADRRALVRRASYGLTGLPPAPVQVEAFASDPRSDVEAFRSFTEDLLASRHYGERWGRHWLDVVRYADTAGENSDHPLPHAWRYRNWVIDAFNDDKRYDDFVREQLAGDLFSKDEPAAGQRAGIVATGYLAIARRFGHDIDKRMHLTYEDAIDNMGKAFLGLSLSCARCHDHKHDPVTMRDYYALYAVFDSTRFSFPGCEPKQQPRDLVPLATDELRVAQAAWQKRHDELKAKLDSAGGGAEAKRLKEAAAKCCTVVSKGEVPDGGSVHVTPKPIEIDVRKGEAIQLSILPRENYGADTTILDYVITHRDGGREVRWSVADLLDDLTRGNPHPAAHGARWCFLDTTGDPKFLTGNKEAVEGKPELKAWENGAPPSVLVNTSANPVKVWTTLPPRTFFVHPGPNGPIALAWLSPLDGLVTIELTVKDGHPAGDGVGWQLEHFADPGITDAYLALAAASGSRSRLEAALRGHAATKPSVPLAFAVAEGEPKIPRLQERGDPEFPGEEVPREFLAVLGGGALGKDQSSGRRELAERIVDPNNPLTARVMVNRIWAWHFGRGLVATPNDFGNHGAPPSHPELLEYLARYFMENDWSVKAVQRLIMASATYQQAAQTGSTPGSFSAFASRRLTAEELRDTLLVAAGTLDLSVGKGHPFPPEASWNFTQHAPFAAEYPTMRRSVYVMRKRNRRSRFFALFDGSDPNASTAQRDVTTAPTQALYFMNDPFFHECAAKFAARIRKAAPDTRGRLDFACRVLFARPVRGDELEGFEEFSRSLRPILSGNAAAVDAETWNAYSRVLLGSNELLHID